MKAKIHLVGKDKNRKILKSALLASVLVLAGCGGEYQAQPNEAGTSQENAEQAIYSNIEVYSGGVLVDSWVVEEEDYRKYNRDPSIWFNTPEGTTVTAAGDHVVTSFSANNFREAIEKGRQITESRPINNKKPTQR